MRNREMVMTRINGTKTVQTAGQYGTAYQQVKLNNKTTKESVTMNTVEIPVFEVAVEEVVERPVVKARKKKDNLSKAQIFGLKILTCGSSVSIMAAAILPFIAQALCDFDGMQYLYMILATTLGTVAVGTLISAIPFIIFTLIRVIFEK